MDEARAMDMIPHAWIFALCLFALAMTLWFQRHLKHHGGPAGFRLSPRDRERVTAARRFNAGPRQALAARYPKHFPAAIIASVHPKATRVELFMAWTDFGPALLSRDVDCILLMHMDKARGLAVLLGFVTPDELVEALGAQPELVNETHGIWRVDAPGEEQRAAVLAKARARAVPDTMDRFKELPVGAGKSAE